MEILIIGILDPWKFSMEVWMEIQFGKLVGNLDRNLDGIFYPWNFGSLEISMQIYFGNLNGNLVWKISWKFRQKFTWNFLSLEFFILRNYYANLLLKFRWKISEKRDLWKQIKTIS